MTDQEQIIHLSFEVAALKAALSVLICGQHPDPAQIGVLTAFARGTADAGPKPGDDGAIRLHQHRYDENAEVWRRAAEFFETVEHMQREMIKASAGAHDQS